MTPFTRRSFLRSTAAVSAVLAVPTLIPAAVRGKAGRPAPSERLTLGCIGTGNNGINWLHNFLSNDRVEVVAVCDVNKRSRGYWADREGGYDVARQVVRERTAQRTKQDPAAVAEIAAYTDYRELLAREDIDAVQIATPDHWHALHVIAAARAGKHIYGQKPLSLTVEEGRKMSDAVRDAGITFQTGSQQRSSIHFRKAIELVRNGFIGKVHTIKVGLPGGHPDYSKHGSEKQETPVPAGLDYNLWLGPAPEAYYCPARLHVNWRWILDYSGGQITDWGAHHIDIAQWAMKNQKTGPVEFTNLKGDFPPQTDLYNTATTYDWCCTYKDGLRMLVGTHQPGGVTFEGDDGKWIFVNRGVLKANPAELVRAKIEDGMERVYESNDHVGNFVDCVFSGKEPIAPIEDAHRTITVAHLANIAMRLGRETLRWDPDREAVIDDAAATAMLTRPYRAPWKLG